MLNRMMGPLGGRGTTQKHTWGIEVGAIHLDPFSFQSKGVAKQTRPGGQAWRQHLHTDSQSQGI